MKTFAYLAVLAAFLALPLTAEAGGCNVQRVQAVQVQQQFVQPVVVQQAVAVPVQAFVAQPVQAVTALQVVQPVVVQQVVQPVVVKQRTVVRRGLFR